MFDVLPVALLLTDGGGKVLDANPAVCRLLGTTEEELLGRPLESLLCETDRPALTAALAQLSPAEPLSLELNVRHGDGRAVQVEMSLLGFDEAHGRYLEVMFEDVVALQRTQIETIRAARDAAVGTLSAGVAHEFNNILGSILACAEDALEQSADPTVRRNMRLVIEKVDQASTITERLLSFAQQEKLNRRPTDLSVLLEQSVEVLSGELGRGGIEIERRYQPAGEVAVDPAKMGRVFVNLLTNAREAMPEGGNLRLSVEPRGGQVVVQIGDTGVGIVPEMAARIFEPFVTTKGLLGGGNAPALGLGLSVCKGIVRAHGGTIGLESTPGKGTMVTIMLAANPPAKCGESS